MKNGSPDKIEKVASERIASLAASGRDCSFAFVMALCTTAGAGEALHW
jgi:hypothetical protein